MPALLLPLRREKRLLALAAAFSLALPYFQQADLLALFMLPVGWLPLLLGNLGYFWFAFSWTALQCLWVAPMTVYAAVVMPAIWEMLRSLLRRKDVPRSDGAFAAQLPERRRRRKDA